MFHGTHAYSLFHHMLSVAPFDSVNIIEGEPNERHMTTGLHVVRDIFCVKCTAHVGWKYVGYTRASPLQHY